MRDYDKIKSLLDLNDKENEDLKKFLIYHKPDYLGEIEWEIVDNKVIVDLEIRLYIDNNISFSIPIVFMYKNNRDPITIELLKKGYESMLKQACEKYLKKGPL